MSTPQAPTSGGRALADLVADLEAAYAGDTQDAYEQALTAVVEHIGSLPTPERDAANELLEQAAGRVAAAQSARELVRLLPTARRGPVRELPDGLEVLELTLGTGDRVAVVMPRKPRPGLPPRVARAVRSCRQAALTGVCPRCAGTLHPTPTGGLAVTHEPGCHADPAWVARAVHRSTR